MSHAGRRFLEGVEFDAGGYYLDDDLSIMRDHAIWRYGRTLLDMSRLPEWRR